MSPSGAELCTAPGSTYYWVSLPASHLSPLQHLISQAIAPLSLNWITINVALKSMIFHYYFYPSWQQIFWANNPIIVMLTMQLENKKHSLERVWLLYCLYCFVITYNHYMYILYIICTLYMMTGETAVGVKCNKVM